jgi:hypothetical protein
MNSLTICLYVTAGLVIGLLAAFAVHNRKVGWKRPRATLAEALDDLYADLGLSDEPLAGPVLVEPHPAERRHWVTSRPEEILVDPNDFSDQLIRLKMALGESAKVGAREIPVKLR